MDISPKLFVRKVFMMLVIARVFRTLSYFFIVTASILPLQLAFASTTTVLQDGLSGYTGTTDTFINAFMPTTNEGGNTTLYSSSYGSNKILVHFDISLIPFGATISSATLSLYISSNTGNGGRNTVNLYRLNRDWIETQATWNAYATGNSWTTAGIGSGTDMSTVVDSVSTVGYSPANIWANFDVISLVQGWVNGTNQNYGVTVFPSGGPSVNVYSSEYGIDTMLRPKLTITYTGGTTPPPSDTSIPTTPTNLSATAVSSSQINLTWTASTDNVGVTGYNVYRGGVQIASVANTSYNDTGLSANTSYTYYVRATDAAGNISNQSISVSATTQFTTPPPSDTSIPTTPTNLSATAASSSQINLSWTASTDNVGVTGYDIYRNNTFLTTTTGTSYSNTTLTANTTYSYYVRAKDAAGNVSLPSTTVSATTQGVTTGATTYYISPTGSDSNSGLSQGAPFKTFAKAFSAMTGGSELVLLNGVYGAAQGTGYISYLGTGSAQPPSGTSSSDPTVVRALNPGSVTVNGGLFIGRSTRKDSYIKIQGITFEGGGSLYNTNYVTVKDSGFHGSFGVGTNDHSNGNTNNLIEDVWVWASGSRIIAINYRADRNVWRRVIVRGDGCGTAGCSGSGNPNVGVTVYNSRDVSFQNVMVADRILSGTDSPYGDFATAQHDPGGGLPPAADYFGRNEWLGPMSVNSPDTAFYFEADTVLAGEPSWTIRNAIAIRPNGTGINIGLPYNGTTPNIIEGLTVVGAGGDGIRVAPGQNGSIVRNIISANYGRYGINSASTPAYVDVYNSAGGTYNQTTCNTGCRTTNPQADGTTPSLLYPVRVEQGSALKGAGLSGADIGANIITRYGIDGARFGDAGYNTPTGTNLWPWPNESRIKAEMCTNTTRGFCSTGKRLDGVNNVTLTSYIWEALGNPLPSSVYGGTSTPAPTVSLSASATSVTSGSSSTLTWSSTNATSCTASGLPAGSAQVNSWSGTKTTSGSQTVTNLPTAGTYTLSCTGSGGTTRGSVTVSVTNTPPPSTGSFTFTATGDIGAKPETTVTLQNMLAQNSEFTFFLGDLSYNQLSSESSWCDYVKGIFGETHPIMLAVGNHEDEAGDGALITEFAKCLPDKIGVTGTYGAEYYFDYPNTNPLARFIVLPAGMKNYPRYENGSAQQQWLGNTIDQARAAGIKWIIVGMHMLCPTMGEKSCDPWNASPGPDLFNFLVSKKVDLVLHGHDHNYQRSKQFALGPSCTTIPVQTDSTPNAAANLNCIVDSDDTLTKGAGTVIIISGITPNYQWPYSLFSNDPEAPYFRKAQNDNYGYTKVTLSDTQLSAQFVATGKSYSGATSFTDSFTISSGGTTPPPSDTSIPTTPTNLSATAVSSSQINLTWTASTDNVGVTGYDIYRNNTFLTTTTGTSYSNTALSANTTYSYYVRAKDVAGNVSSPSTTVSGTTQSTTSPPPSAKFSLNDRVQVQSGPLNVRATASATGTLLGSQGTGNLGTIIGGPISANGFNWWNINYDNAPDGWSAEDYVVKYTASTPPPSTDCSATSVRCVDDTAGSTQEYSTIQAAINAASAGDTILVHDGTYAGFGIRSKSGTATNPITIRGIGRALINQKEPGGSGEFIYTTFSGYFIIENLEVDCTSGTGFCVGIHSGSTTPNRGIVIRGNKVYNGQSTNIYLSHAADSLVENNITYGSRASHGIYLANGGSDNTTIRGNLSYNNSKNGIHLNGDLSVGGDGLITGVVIEQNILHDNNLQGVDMDGAQNGTIRNNLIYNNRYIGIVGFQIDGATGPKNHKIYNNTIMIPSTSGNYAIEMKDGDLGGHTIFNNILMTAGSGGSIAVGNTNFTSNNNIVIGKFSVDEESTTMNFASWQSRGYDTNSIVSTASALFTNSTTNDYTLKSGSPAIDKGVSAFNAVSAPTTDILGVSRQGTAYDTGAYEYASGGGTTPPSTTPTISLSANPTSVTSGNLSTLTWSSTNATSCSASGLPAGSAQVNSWSGTKATSGSQTLTNLTTTGTYTLSCTGSGGTSNASATITVTPPPTCATFTYSAWSACQSNNTQSRTTTASSPQGCTGGTPLLTQSCTYVPPTTPTQTTCTTFTYSAWGTCQSNNTQSRTTTSTSPQGCTGGTPMLMQSCIYTPPASSGGSGGSSSSGGGTSGGTTTTGGGTTSTGTTGGITSTTGTTGGGTTTGTTGTGTTTGGTTTTSSVSTFPTLTGPFSIGMRSEQVKLLQQMLKQDGVFTEEPTGYYGALTQKAVEQFQTKYNLVTSGTPGTTGYGLAGPGTRAKLNALYAGTSGGSTTLTEDARAALIASLQKQVALLVQMVAELTAKLQVELAKRGAQ